MVLRTRPGFLESRVDDEAVETTRKSKRQRFLTVGEKRTVRVLRALRLLGNCGNRAAYEYTVDEVQKIFIAIQRELDRARDRFGRPSEIDFSLGDDDGDAEEENRHKR